MSALLNPAANMLCFLVVFLLDDVQFVVPGYGGVLSAALLSS